MEQLLELLKRLESLDFEPDKNLDLILKLDQIYVTDFRHSYYELSKYLQVLDEERRDSVCGNIDKLLVFVNERPDFRTKDKLCSGIFKLADHMNLETIRINRLKGLEFIGERANVVLQKANETYLENKERVDELKQQVNGFQGQSITVLGIFAGLVIGFATGSDLLMGTFANLNALNMSKMSFYVLIIGLILFNLIFLLMYCVSKISDSSLAVTCRKKNCNVCRKHKLWIARLYHKYPYIVWFNGIVALLLVALIVVKIRVNV